MRLFCRLRAWRPFWPPWPVWLSPAVPGEPARHSRQYYEYFDTVSTVIGYGSEEEFQRPADLVAETLDTYHRLCHI